MDDVNITFTTDEVERIVLLWIKENYAVGHLQYNGNEINPETDAMTFTFGPPEDDDE